MLLSKFIMLCITHKISDTLSGNCQIGPGIPDHGGGLPASRQASGYRLARALSGHGAEAVRNAIAARIVQLPEHFTQLTDLATQTV